MYPTIYLIPFRHQNFIDPVPVNSLKIHPAHIPRTLVKHAKPFVRTNPKMMAPVLSHTKHIVVCQQAGRIQIRLVSAHFISVITEQAVKSRNPDKPVAVLVDMMHHIIGQSFRRRKVAKRQIVQPSFCCMDERTTEHNENTYKCFHIFREKKQTTYPITKVRLFLLFTNREQQVFLKKTGSLSPEKREGFP